MDYKNILIVKKNGYAIIKFNRAHEMNALSKEMRLEFNDALLDVENDPQMRVLIITGGEYVFSAGMDIKEMSSLANVEIDDYFESMKGYLKKYIHFLSRLLRLWAVLLWVGDLTLLLFAI